MPDWGVTFCTAALMCMATIQRRVPSCQASLKDAGEVMRWPYRVCSMWSTGGVSRRGLCGASVAIFGCGRGHASPLGRRASESRVWTIAEAPHSNWHHSLVGEYSIARCCPLFNHIDIVAFDNTCRYRVMHLERDCISARPLLCYVECKAIPTPAANIDFALLQAGFVGS